MEEHKSKLMFLRCPTEVRHIWQDSSIYKHFGFLQAELNYIFWDKYLFKIFSCFLLMLRWFERHYLISWSITLLGAVGIFVISSISFAPSVALGINILPILYHLSAFFLFSAFLELSIVRGRKSCLLFFFAILLAFSYGISDEIHQFFVPGRFCSFSDVLIDGVGIIFASLIYLISLEFRNSSGLATKALKRVSIIK